MENEFLKLVYKTIDDKQGKDIEIIDFQNHSPLFDYMVIASVLNERMANAIVEALKDLAVAQNHSIISVDKAAESKWFLIDLGDIICHIFYDGQRAFYDLEGLWKDLGTIKM